MANIIFILVVASGLSFLYFWAFKHLTHERWQILGSIPLRKEADGQWQGLNLTYYGVIGAGAVTFGALMTFILLAAIGLPVMLSAGTLSFILVFCALCAKWIARLVEKKKHTFSIGGAAFCGMAGSPLLLLMLQPVISHWGAFNLPVMPFVSAMTVGYTFGEGTGRLACLSYGCCYGKPIASLPEKLRSIAAPFAVTFHSETQKAAYAGGLRGQKILAIQAITAVVYSITGLVAAYLFLQGYVKSAFLLSVLVTQIWRILSEFGRADFRGGGRISTYQHLAAVAALLAIIYSFLLPSAAINPHLIHGLRILWNPLVMVMGQLLWLAIFLFIGRSQITASRISLFVRTDRI